MANVNKVILIGNLTRDPELKFLPSQTAVCEFGLAVNRTWTGQDGIKKEEVTFVDCSAFGRQAETLNKYMKKGNPLFVEGRLKLDQWEAQDGSKRSKMHVVIENFQFLGGGRAGDQSGTSAGEYAGEPQSQPAAPSYAPRQQAAPRPAYNRPPAGRPAPQPMQAPQNAGNQPAPDYDAGDAMPEDAPQTAIKDEEIPF